MPSNTAAPGGGGGRPGGGGGGARAPPRREHSHPLPPPDLEHIARHVIQQPDDLPLQIGLAVQSLQPRAGDPLMTLIALRRLLSQLIPIVANSLFTSELQALLQHLPTPMRRQAQTLIQKSVPRDSPEKKVLLLRKLEKQLMEQNN